MEDEGIIAHTARKVATVLSGFPLNFTSSYCIFLDVGFREAIIAALDADFSRNAYRDFSLNTLQL